jgi:L,D-peptidoglycan transpeptidase YkuD (ErfK/YbiS/YcfS/YnhG family)
VSAPVLRVGRWGARFGGRAFPCSIGRGGLRADKREGDGATPVGRFRLARVLWRPDRLPRPRTALPAALIGPRDGWSDDPGDPRYNRAVRLPHGFSAERMRRGDRLYDVVVVTTHNVEGAPGAGSAIFVHLRKRPGARTAGCVGLRRADLLWLLARWPRRGVVEIKPR